MVFQSTRCFPHTVFGTSPSAGDRARLRKPRSPTPARKRCGWCGGLMPSGPRQLSGGQQQRVAIARHRDRPTCCCSASRSRIWMTAARGSAHRIRELRAARHHHIMVTHNRRRADRGRPSRGDGGGESARDAATRPLEARRTDLVASSAGISTFWTARDRAGEFETEGGLRLRRAGRGTRMLLRPVRLR